MIKTTVHVKVGVHSKTDFTVKCLHRGGNRWLEIYCSVLIWWTFLGIVLCSAAAQLCDTCINIWWDKVIHTYIQLSAIFCRFKHWACSNFTGEKKKSFVKFTLNDLVSCHKQPDISEHLELFYSFPAVNPAFSSSPVDHNWVWHRGRIRQRMTVGKETDIETERKSRSQRETKMFAQGE